MMSASQPHAFAALVREFMHSPAAYVDPSWLPAGWADQFATRRAGLHARALQVLSQWLLHEHALANEDSWHWDRHELRIALIEAPAIVRLARYVGIWRYSRSIRAEVERTRVAGLVAALGLDGYAFALECAPPSTPPLALPYLGTDLHSQFLREGIARLLAVIGAVPDAISRRMNLKLPRTIVQGEQPPLASADVRETAAYLPRLVAEKEPQWALLF